MVSAEFQKCQLCKIDELPDSLSGHVNCKGFIPSYASVASTHLDMGLCHVFAGLTTSSAYGFRTAATRERELQLMTSTSVVNCQTKSWKGECKVGGLFLVQREKATY